MDLSQYKKVAVQLRTRHYNKWQSGQREARFWTSVDAPFTSRALEGLLYPPAKRLGFRLRSLVWSLLDCVDRRAYGPLSPIRDTSHAPRWVEAVGPEALSRALAALSADVDQRPQNRLYAEIESGEISPHTLRTTKSLVLVNLFSEKLSSLSDDRQVALARNVNEDIAYACQELLKRGSFTCRAAEEAVKRQAQYLLFCRDTSLRACQDYLSSDDAFKVAMCPYPSARFRLAFAPGAPAGILTWLAHNDPDIEVRRNVAANEATPAETLDWLALNDKDEGVRRYAALRVAPRPETLE